MQAQANYRYIEGTEGNIDYLVVGSKEGMILAVKAIVDSGLPYLPIAQFGMRVRCTADTETKVTSIPHMAKSAYPDVSFTKEADTHCSVAWAMKGPIPDDPTAANKVLGEKVMPEIWKKFDEEIVSNCDLVPADEVKAWVQAQFDAKIAKMYGKETPQADDDSPKAKADVVPFKNGDSDEALKGKFFED